MRLREVVRQNPWWRDGTLEGDPDLRRAPPILLPRRDLELEKDNIYTLEGPRRVGKTLWIKLKIKKLLESGIDPERIGYFLVERSLSRRELSRVLDFFMERGVDYLFLDEAQGVRNWALEVKRYWEENPGSIIVVTGSPLYLEEEREILLGRGIEGNRYYIYPFNFRDFVLAVSEREGLSSSKLEKDPFPFMEELIRLFRVYFIAGGFPKPLVSYYLSGSAKDQYLLEVREQVKRRAEEPDEVEELAVYLSKRIGSVLSLQGIARDFGRDIHWVERKLRFLIRRHMIFEARALGRKGKPLRRGQARKFYFVDHSVPLVLRAPKEDILRHIEIEIYPDEVIRGQILEQIVAQHLKKAVSPGESLYFVRRNGETDFVWKNTEIEVKLSGKKRKGALVVSWDEYDEGVIPAPLFLLKMEKNGRFL